MGLDMWLYEKEVTEVAYWRKSNAIHGWFVDTINDGVDDCTPIEVRKQDIILLRDLCESLIKTKDAELAAEILPPTAGFFFGNDEIDEDYWLDIQETIDKLNTIIDQSTEDAVFEYQASW